jgi:hypothetical protein
MDKQAAANAFLDELEALYVKHGLSLSHQDNHGSFIIQNGVPQHARNLAWVRAASLDIEPFTPLDPKDIEPVDLQQCQAEVPNGCTVFSLGGVPGKVRCKNRPTAILKEHKIGRDGHQGQMSVCEDCCRQFLLAYGAGVCMIEPIPQPDPNAPPKRCQAEDRQCTEAPTKWVLVDMAKDNVGRSLAVCTACAERLLTDGDTTAEDVEEIQ